MHAQFAELPVFDQDRAKALYVDIFDCRVAGRSSHRQGRLEMDRLRFAGGKRPCTSSGAGMRLLSPCPFLVFVDDDVEATLERLKPRGAKGALATGTHVRGVSRQ